MAKAIERTLSGEVPSDWEQRLVLQVATRECLKGNPFPLIALLWPELIVTDPEEAKWFEGKIGDDYDPCLRIDLWQRDLIRSFFTEGMREMRVKGCTKAGKGFATAIAINLWWRVHSPCKIILTGPNVRHVRNGVFAEVKAWHLKASIPMPETIVQVEGFATEDPQKFIVIGNAESPEAFSGQHGPWTLFVFDEASQTPDNLYGLSYTQARFIAVLSNPRYTTGWFFDGFPKVDPDLTQTIEMEDGFRRRLITVSGFDCVNVRAGKELILAQVTKGILAGVMANPAPFWGRTFGEGKFPPEDAEHQVILPSWFPRHTGGWKASEINVQAFGLDVGASVDGDPSCLVAGGTEGIAGIHVRKEEDVLKVADWAVSVAREKYKIDLTTTRVPVVVDAIGVGKGTYNALRRLGVNAFRADEWIDHKTYGNWRAERYGEFGRRLNPDDNQWGNKLPFLMPNDKELLEELAAHERIPNLTGGFIVSPKNRKAGSRSTVKTIKEKLGRSPNRSDAVVYLWLALAASARKVAPRINRPLANSVMGEPPAKKPPKMTPEENPTPVEVKESVADVANRMIREWDGASGFGWR